MLCEDGDRSTSVGRMRDLEPLDGDVVELDGRGLCAIPGLVDCHTHPCFAGDRVEEFALRAAGATYEELHAAGGGIISTVRATRAAGEDDARRGGAQARAAGCSRAGTTTFEGKSGYGLDHETELASLRAVRAAGGIPTWLGAHAVPPEFDDADAYLDFALREVLPEAAQLAEAADVFLERGAFDAGPGSPLPRGVSRTPVSRFASTAISSPSGRRRARDRARRALGRPPRGDRRDGGPRARASDVVGVLLPASALFLARPMPPARALVDAGAASRSRPTSTRQRVLREPAARLLARCTQLQLSPAEALAACTVNAAHVLGRADRDRAARTGLRRRHRPPRRTGLALPRVPPRRRPRRRGRPRRRPP